MTVKKPPYLELFIGMLFLFSACGTGKTISDKPNVSHKIQIDPSKSGGGSSGMEQIGAQSYLVVYDFKSHNSATRIGFLKVNDASLEVLPIAVSSWGDGGIPNDLESICAIPGKQNEFLVAEPGSWQGTPGRIFHINVDTVNLKGKVLGTVKLPFLQDNDFDLVGDQYEAMLCLPYDERKRIVVMAERGGSQLSPEAIIRWGVLDLKEYSLTMEETGLKGKTVNAPGNWTNNKTKRSITDFHLDEQGGIWASASEDQGDQGPFYSVVYQLGKTNAINKEQPITVFEEITAFKPVYGFKIEALSGPRKGTNSTHSFGTEDEIYDGVWRPININANN